MPHTHDVRDTGGDDPERSRSVLFVVTTCFVLSGIAALIYQTAWLRQFTLVFGTSHLAVATVLAAYMAGLAIGAAVAARMLERIKRPIYLYGLLEAGIAISALCIPLLLDAASALYGNLLGSRPEPPDAAAIGQPIFYLAVGFLVLLLPTAFMGATLPLLARHAITSNRQVGPRISLLYASNTAGAVMGTVIAGFILLPRLGLVATVWVAVALNIIVFLIAATLARFLPPENFQHDPGRRSGIPIGFWSSCLLPLFRKGKPIAARIRSTLDQQPGWMFILILLSGANALFYEVLWTRMLSHVLGGSVYAFATMLAAFLTGIALGGGLAGPFADSQENAARRFAIAQVAIALLSIGIYHWMDFLIPESRSIAAMAGMAAAVLLPATIFIGATFPLAVRTLARDDRDAAAVTAKVFSFNTVGAIGGAVLAGYYLIPALGFEGSIKLAVIVNLSLALWAVSFIAQRSRVAIAGVATLTVALALIYQPDRPQTVVRNSVLLDLSTRIIEELYFAVGRSSTVQLVDIGDSFQLRTNGLPEASILPLGAPPILHPQQMLTTLPVLARPDIRKMLIVGYGGGVAIERTPESVEYIDVIELEPEVINANRRIAELRADDPLADDRVSVIFNDGRNALTLTSKIYDSIVSQPSHPWTAGASHLFTKEFIEIAKDHLSSDGVYLHWINASFVDEELLKSLAATLLDVFEYVRVYRAGADDLMFLASDARLDTELNLLRTGRPLSDNALFFGYSGINAADDLIAMLALDENGTRDFAAGAPLSTDNRNRMAMQSRYRGDGLIGPELDEIFAPHDPLFQEGSWILEELGGQLDFAYLANRLIRTQQPERARRLAEASSDDSMQALITGLIFQFRGDDVNAKASFENSLRFDPGNDAARFALISVALPDFARGDASNEMQALAASLPAAPAAVVRGWPLGAAQDWAALAQLDNDLASSEETDIWYPYTAMLRAEWRIRVANNEQYPLEAVEMIDRALLISPDLNLYVLRATAAVALQDDPGFIASTQNAHNYLREKLERARAGRFQLSDEDAQRTLSRISALSSRLNDLAASGERRATRVLETMNDLSDDYRTFIDAR